MKNTSNIGVKCFIALLLFFKSSKTHGGTSIDPIQLQYYGKEQYSLVISHHLLGSVGLLKRIPEHCYYDEVWWIGNQS